MHRQLKRFEDLGHNHFGGENGDNAGGGLELARVPQRGQSWWWSLFETRKP